MPDPSVTGSCAPASPIRRPAASGPICFYCEGRGKVQRFVRRLRCHMLVTCTKCGGTGHREAA